MVASNEMLDALEAEHIRQCPMAAVYSTHTAWRPGNAQKLASDYIDAVNSDKHPVECLTKLKRFRANR